MNKIIEDEPVYETGSDLLQLTQAAIAAGFSRNHFNRLCLGQVTPPPIMITSRRRWSAKQLQLWLEGLIHQGKDGRWYQTDRNSGESTELANQYNCDLPKSAA